MSYGRKKTQSQGGNYNNNNNHNNQQRGKQRFSHGGQNNRPRKNYGAMREKYLAQARDALAAGDRVLAENYFQHADHCFRMLAEEQASRPQRQHFPREQQVSESAVEAPEQVTEDVAEGDATEVDDTISMNVTSLPSFLTANYTPPKKDEEPVPPVSWEEE